MSVPGKKTAAEATACAKAILIGEHAVVYGSPAVAAPLSSVRALARILPGNPAGRGIFVQAPDLNRSGMEDADGSLAPLALAARLAFERSGNEAGPVTLFIKSSIPKSAGMGSGAAVAVATARAAFAYAGATATAKAVSEIAFEVEKIHHGRPSGIDNSVVTLERPVYFSREAGPVALSSKPFQLVAADTGSRSLTRDMVEKVRLRMEVDPARVKAAFAEIGESAERARLALEAGDIPALGKLMNSNHAVLADLGVSSEKLDRLVFAALEAGAAGAKLTGAGGGGCVIALAHTLGETAGIAASMMRAGAESVLATVVTGS